MSDTAVAIACFATGAVFAAITAAMHLPVLLGLAFGFPVAMLFILQRGE